MIEPIRKSTGTFKSFDGTLIYYEVRGSGPPLVFCYGIACLFNHWTHQISEFSKNYQTIIFDYRGHHMSDIPIDKSLLTIDAIAKDLFCLLEHLKIPKATIIGHSFGTPVILSAYRQNPDCIEGIVFINGMFRNPFEILVSSAELLSVLEKIKKFYNQAPEVFNYLWEKGVQNPLMVPISAILGGFNLSKTALKDIEIYARGVAQIDLRVFLTLFEDMAQIDESDLLPQIHVPVLVISGSKDVVTPIEEQREMAEKITKSELFVVPYGSHCTQLDFPVLVNSKIKDFLKALDL